MPLDATYGMEKLWGGPKLWLFYPPRAPNLAALAATFGQQERLQRCHAVRSLSGGFAILQREGETVLLPPYWPHATFALGASVLAGREAAFADELPKELANVGLDMRAAELEAERPRVAAAWVKEHVKGLVKRVQDALLGCKDESTCNAICRMWTAQKKELLPLLERCGATRKAANAWMAVLGSGWGHEAVRLVECPLCDHEDLDLAAHITATHMAGKGRR